MTRARPYLLGIEARQTWCWKVDRVKHELRTDSAAVQKRDAHYFFCLAEWLLAWRRERAAVLSRRLSRAAREGSSSEDFSESVFFPRSLLKLVDVFTVKSCLDDLSRAKDRKQRLEVERSASLYREILRALEALQHGDRDSRKDRSRLLKKDIPADETCVAVARACWTRSSSPQKRGPPADVITRLEGRATYQTVCL